MSEFGLVTDNEFFTIKNGENLIFKVRRQDYGSSTQSPGDIASLIYKGVEYQDKSRGSQINSGFDWLYNGIYDVKVEAELINDDIVKVTVRAGYLTHYYIVRKGEDNIYMGTYFTQQPDVHGHVRYILRTNYSLLPYGPEPSDLHGTTKTIESADIFSTDDGHTKSKHYSNQRLKDWSYIGATGDNVGLWVVRGNAEGMSGGPFYRSLLNQASEDQEITYIINYGMAQTDVFRTKILNLYTLVFNDGSQPEEPVLTWLADANLLGWIPLESRGGINCTGIDGLDGKSTYTVSFSNKSSFYWCIINNITTQFKCEGLIPGEYDLTIFKNELEVLKDTVTVTSGATTQISHLTITDDPSFVESLWRIGEWDGSPQELMNGDKITVMHPTDVRMSDWTPETYTIGQSVPNKHFPAYQCRNINNDIKINFHLTREQLGASRLRIGTTTAGQGGRPAINVNGWIAKSGAPVQPKTRNITVGTYRGFNTLYTFDIPEGVLKEGENTLTISVISGSGGAGWLGPSFAYDAVDLIRQQ